MGVGQCVCVSFSCAATAGPDLHLPCVTHRVIPAQPTAEILSLVIQDASSAMPGMRAVGATAVFMCAASTAAFSVPPLAGRVVVHSRARIARPSPAPLFSSKSGLRALAMEEGSAVSERGQSVAVESAAEKETFIFTKQWCALMAMCTAISTAHRK